MHSWAEFSCRKLPSIQDDDEYIKSVSYGLVLSTTQHVVNGYNYATIFRTDIFSHDCRSHKILPIRQ